MINKLIHPFGIGQKVGGDPKRSASKPVVVIKPQEKNDKVITDESGLPAYHTVMTAQDGKYAIGESFQNRLAAIAVGVNSAIILASEEANNRQDFASLQSRVKKDFPDVSVLLVKSSVLLSIYSKVASSIRRDRDENEMALSIQTFKALLTGAAKRNASDVHFVIRDDNTAKTAAVLYRVDGSLRVTDKIPAKNAIEAVGAAFTKMAEESSRSVGTFNRLAMLSCSIPVVLDGRHYKLRYQTIPVNGGLDVIVRLLQTASTDSTNAKSLEELGYSPTQCKQLDFAARKTVGAIVVSGVTGSGKSTTLKTLMTQSPSRHMRKSYSIEDPVEYKIFGVSQISVQRGAEETGSSGFTAAMRVVLRADPDVVMVGEVRDSESCSLLKTMVQSGHQVMTTVHAASAIDIVQRMTSTELGLPREALGSRNFISALVYQRLVPVLCPECKIPLEKFEGPWVPEEALRLLRSKFGMDTSKMFTSNPLGCEHCHGMGSKGVTVVAEIIMPDTTILKMLHAGRDVEAEEYWRSTRRTGFDHPDSTGKTAFEHGLYKASLGMVDPMLIESSFEPFETYEVYPIKQPAEQ